MATNKGEHMKSLAQAMRTTIKYGHINGPTDAMILQALALILETLGEKENARENG